jgi:hypothetical protein
VIHRTEIEKGTVLSVLGKTSYIVEQSHREGKPLLLIAPAEFFGYPGTVSRHPAAMFLLEHQLVYFAESFVIGRHVGVKPPTYFFFIELHEPKEPPFSFWYSKLLKIITFSEKSGPLLMVTKFCSLTLLCFTEYNDDILDPCYEKMRITH